MESRSLDNRLKNLYKRASSPQPSSNACVLYLAATTVPVFARPLPHHHHHHDAAVTTVGTTSIVIIIYVDRILGFFFLGSATKTLAGFPLIVPEVLKLKRLLYCLLGVGEGRVSREMASSLFKPLKRSMAVMGASCMKGSSSRLYEVADLLKMSASGCPCSVDRKLALSKGYANASAYHGNGSEESERRRGGRKGGEEEAEEFPTEGISKPLSEVLKQLNKKVPDSLISVRSEDGFQVKYIPWHIVNRIMNLHSPEWSGEVRNITYSPDGKSVSVVYRVTLYGTDAEIFRESTGTASVEDKGYGDAVQKAEAMAFRRACARLGLGLHLYHEDMS